MHGNAGNMRDSLEKNRRSLGNPGEKLGLFPPPSGLASVTPHCAMLLYKVASVPVQMSPRLSATFLFDK